MTNLDSVLKNRDITLLTKVFIVIVFSCSVASEAFEAPLTVALQALPPLELVG